MSAHMASPGTKQMVYIGGSKFPARAVRQLGRLGANFSIDPTKALLAAFLPHFDASTALFCSFDMCVFEKSNIIIESSLLHLCQPLISYSKPLKWDKKAASYSLVSATGLV